MSPLTSIVTTDGLRLSATAVGAGPAGVIVPNGAYFADDLARIWARHPALVYDLRNRGASDPVADAARLERGVLQDVDDLETVRLALGADQIDLVAHSYVGVVAMLYAAAHPDRVRRRSALAGPPDPAIHPTPPPDETMRRVFARLAALRQPPPPVTPKPGAEGSGRRSAKIYVADSARAAAVRHWGRCDCRTSAPSSATGPPMSSRRFARRPPPIGISRV